MRDNIRFALAGIDGNALPKLAQVADGVWRNGLAVKGASENTERITTVIIRVCVAMSEILSERWKR